MFYDESLIIGRVPKKIKERTKENMEEYNMCLSDSFEEAVCTIVKRVDTFFKEKYLRTVA